MAFGKPTKGICSECGEEKYYAHNAKKLCLYCNEKRKRAAKTNKPALSSKRKVTGEAEVFRKIWGARKRVSFLSGKSLVNFEEKSKFWYWLFAHLLPKGKYPEMQLNPNNIILLTPKEHNLLDHGTEADREAYALENDCNWEKVYLEKQKMRSKLERP